MTCLAEPVQNRILDRLYQIFNGVILVLENLFWGGIFDGAFKEIMRGAVPGLAVHFERKTDHHTNKEIDVSQTYLNQDIMTDGSDMVSRFNARLNDVYWMQRDDVKGC